MSDDNEIAVPDNADDAELDSASSSVVTPRSADRVQLTDTELANLKSAKNLLENPGFAAKATNLLGSPIEKGIKALPDNFQKSIANVTESALRKALEVAVLTMNNKPGQRSSNNFHMGAAALLGAVGGAGGIAALSIELPISTTVMIRSIIDVARSEGEDIKDVETQLACLEVFALGGPSTSDDGAEAGYFAVRAALGKVISDAAAHIAQRGLSKEASPALIKLVVQIAERFSVQVTPKAAAQMIPGIGAIGGAVINTAFTDHFQRMARGHFIMRRLIKKYGLETIQLAYQEI